MDASLFVPNLFGNVFDYLHRKIPHHILVHNRISRSRRRCPRLSILCMFHECTHESHRDLMRKMKSKNYYSNYSTNSSGQNFRFGYFGGCILCG